MTALKTLKDLSIEGSNTGQGLNEYDLKQEAIKWYHRSDGNKHKFIKHFFNLTEKEIKEGSKRCV